MIAAALAAVLAAAFFGVWLLARTRRPETSAEYAARLRREIARENSRGLNDPSLYIRRAGDRHGAA